MTPNTDHCSPEEAATFWPMDSESGDKRYCSISLVDGMVLQPHSKEELAAVLNEGKYVPMELINRK